MSRKLPVRWPRHRAQACALGLGLTLAGLSLSAQQPSLGVLKNFAWPDYFPPPHETQLRFLLKGAEARPQAEGQIIVSNVVVEKFLETGVREVLIETPECAFDPNTRDVNSPGSLRVQFEDGRLVLQGEGFSWQQTNALLVVSNRVRTQLRGGGPAVKTNAEPPVALLGLGDTEIRGDRFTYDHKAAMAVYRGQVQVASSNLSLGCGTLTFKLPAAGSNALELLMAEENVAMQLDELRASSDRAIYTASNGLMHLTGKAFWEAQGREGRGNEMLLNSVLKTMQVNGGASLRLPVGDSGFIPQQAALIRTGRATNRFVAITSERYELQTNRASFTGAVRVTERVGDQELASLTAGTLLATLGASNQMQSLVAEQGVVIAESSRRLTGERAAYDGVGGVLELTGQPTWQDGQYSGRGTTLLADLPRTRLTVRGDASVILPRTQTGSLLGALAVKPSPGSVSVIKTNAAAAPQLTRILCDEYEFTAERLTFRGNVRVDDAQMQLTSGALDVKLSPGGTNVVSLVADRNVVMNLIEASNQVTRARCARVVYTGTNDVLELSGQPVVLRCTPEATNNFSADVIVLNRATGSVSALGSSRGTVQAPLGSRTNATALPFGRKP